MVDDDNGSPPDGDVQPSRLRQTADVLDDLPKIGFLSTCFQHGARHVGGDELLDALLDALFDDYHMTLGTDYNLGQRYANWVLAKREGAADDLVKKDKV